MRLLCSANGIEEAEGDPGNEQMLRRKHCDLAFFASICLVLGHSDYNSAFFIFCLMVFNVVTSGGFIFTPGSAIPLL